MVWDKAYQQLMDTAFLAFIYYEIDNEKSRKAATAFWHKRDSLLSRYLQGERSPELYKEINELKVDTITK